MTYIAVTLRKKPAYSIVHSYRIRSIRVETEKRIEIDHNTLTIQSGRVFFIACLSVHKKAREKARAFVRKATELNIIFQEEKKTFLQKTRV
jgi:hypothetical protein